MNIIAGRKTAAFRGPLVVFVIGMRINHFHKIAKWLPVLKAMPLMLEKLAKDPDSGYLGSENMIAGLRQVCLLQYWRDFDSLEAYARSRDREHWPSWVDFNKRVGSDGTVGIFHETYAVDAGRYETIYGNMPVWGLGKVAGLTDATGQRNEARSRMKTSVK